MLKTGDFRFHYSAIVFGLNLTAIVLGLTYLLFPGQSAFWDFSGWLFLVSWVATLTLLLLVPRATDSTIQSWKKVDRIRRGTLAILGVVTIGMFGASFLLSITTSNAISQIGGILALLYGSFFACTIANCLFAFMIAKQSKFSLNSASPSLEKNMDAKRTKLFTNRKGLFVHIGALFVCAAGIGAMSYFAVLSLAGTKLGAYELSGVGVTNGVMGLVSASFAWLFSVFTWSATAGGVKILLGLRRSRFAKVFALFGLIIGSILLAPMIAVPLMVSETNTRFGEAYGTNWETRIPTSALPYFKPNKLVAAEYFLSHPLGDCVLKEDISFYNGSGGIDNDLKLLFDAYLPPSTRNLPGANSTLIRIHGGGWTVGDKGTGNMPLMNRYFATQGYCVFDIQYGLNNQSNILPFAESITPQTVKGNFSINDMVRHVGIFCQYLVTHQSEYPANLSSVFISGGSAGGHLTCVTALAIASGNYSSLFGPGITIKGYVPFYPANDLAKIIDGGISNKEFYDPTLLISASSPPCLVYQGNQDGLVNPKTAQDLKDQYSNHENPSCMVIFLPFAGHGSDIDFYGYYNQFFLYYMERFLYLYR